MTRPLFNDWPDRYAQWFDTPTGSLVRQVELDLVMSMLRPNAGDRIVDAGCGSGIFTAPIVACGAGVIGIDIAGDMLRRAVRDLPGSGFSAVRGDLLTLPFEDDCFDHAVSITALEFIDDGAAAIRELFRVTRRGGRVVVATLNRRSSWASRRAETARRNADSVFRHAVFRTPEQLMALAPVAGTWRTAVFFNKDHPPDTAARIESDASDDGRGAFLTGCWIKAGAGASGPPA